MKYETIGVLKIIEVHIDSLTIGDSILCEDGRIRTLGRNNIKRSEFMGRSIWGDNYKCGHKLVKKVLYKPANKY